uniref:Odorant-binding protein OBP35 n=1 Tax=Lobesia botrana TaxID=209534 RepID=A0A345BEQ8_9NEOP|nr:odorant-binding protein OBP35 [Lobesia botrana]
MMMRGCVLFAVLHLISAQGQFPPGLPPNFPQKCLGPPPAVEKPHECCPIPPFFSDEDFAECGFQRLEEGNDAPQKRGPPDCSKQLCMLKKYDLLLEDEGIDEEAIKKFLDDWAEKNAEFQAAAEIAKERCIGRNLQGPPQICEANKLVFCVSSIIFDKCPTWQETEGCTTLRAHMDDCRPPFPN